MTEKTKHPKEILGMPLNIFISIFIWLTVGVFLHIFWRDIEGGIFIFVEGLMGLYWIISIILLVWLLVTLVINWKNRYRFPILGLIIFFALVSTVLFQYGREYGRLIWFYSHKPRYEKILADIEKDPNKRSHSYYYGSWVMVEQGPPQIVAFQLPGGILDNYQAFVYDPSGHVGQLQKFNGEVNWIDPELDHLRAAFGGVMYYCEPLQESWYYCYFT
jgi:hypothetical protein